MRMLCGRGKKAKKVCIQSYFAKKNVSSSHSSSSNSSANTSKRIPITKVSDVVDVATSREKYISNLEQGIIKEFLEILEPKLSRFLDESVIKDKFVVTTLLKLANEYNGIAPNRRKVLAVESRKTKTKLRENLSCLDADLVEIKFLISEAADIQIKSSLGLSLLQENVVKRNRLLVGISSVAAKISILITGDIKNALTRRVKQIESLELSRYHSGSNFQNMEIFCYNSSELSWKVALENIRQNYQALKGTSAVSVEILCNVGLLLDSSSIVPIETVYDHIGNQCNKSFINYLLKLFPLFYLKTVKKREYFD